MAWLDEGRLLAVDSGNGRLVLLAFDGERLSWLGEWTDGLRRPQGIAVLPRGQVLLSDRGDQTVKLLSAAGDLLRTWTGPTDGHEGNFWLPAGLALLPDGDVLVADAGNGRMVRIHDPLGKRTRYFPLLLK